MSPSSQLVYQRENQCTLKRANADYHLRGKKAILSQCIQDRTVTCWDNHRRLLSATCNSFLCKLKCSCKVSALFVGHHLQKDSSEMFILSSFEGVKMCRAVSGYMTWSHTGVHSMGHDNMDQIPLLLQGALTYTPISFIKFRGLEVNRGCRICSLRFVLVCQTTKTQLLMPPSSLAEASVASAIPPWS